MEGVGEGQRGRLGRLEEGAAVLGHELAVVVDLPDAQALQVIADQEVGAVAGADGAQLAQAEVGGRVDGGELDGPQRVQPQGDGLAHHGVHVAVLLEVAAGAVVHHQQAAGGRAVGDQGQQLLQVLLGGALADHQVHAAAELLAPLLQAGRLVVGAGAGGQVGVEGFAPQAGGVAVDGPVAYGVDLVQAGAVAGDDAGEVHHLAQPDGARQGQGLGDVLGPQGGAGGLQVGGGHAGGDHQAQLQGQAGRRLHRLLHAGQAGDVGDLVQVAHGDGRAVRHHGAGVLADPEHGALDVGVAVDEAGQEVGAVQVDGLLRLVAGAQAGHPALVHEDVRLLDLAGEGVDDAGVAEEQVPGDVAPGGRDEVLPAHHSPSMT